MSSVEAAVVTYDFSKRQISREQESEEEILQEEEGRFVMDPIIYTRAHELYKIHMSVQWTWEEIDLGMDPKSWITLSAGEKHFIKYVLAFFAGIDGMVLENIGKNFMDKVKKFELKAFYCIQALMETVHAETYIEILKFYVPDKKERDFLINSFKTIPEIAAIAKAAEFWMNGNRSFHEILVFFMCLEGIMFSGPFAAIYYMKEKGKLPGLCASNEFIARDEGLHVIFASHEYSLLHHKIPEPALREIITICVNLSKGIMKAALPVALIGMNGKMMCQYIEFVGDRLAIDELKITGLYGVDNPFNFMERIRLEGKTNFFEKRVSEYSKRREKRTKAKNIDDLTGDAESFDMNAEF